MAWAYLYAFYTYTCMSWLRAWQSWSPHLQKDEIQRICSWKSAGHQFCIIIILNQWLPLAVLLKATSIVIVTFVVIKNSDMNNWIVADSSETVIHWLSHRIVFSVSIFVSDLHDTTNDHCTGRLLNDVMQFTFALNWNGSGKEWELYLLKLNENDSHRCEVSVWNGNNLMEMWETGTVA